LDLHEKNDFLTLTTEDTNCLINPWCQDKMPVVICRIIEFKWAQHKRAA